MQRVFYTGWFWETGPDRVHYYLSYPNCLVLKTWYQSMVNPLLTHTLRLHCLILLHMDPSGIFLPGTELLQSPFRTEFSKGSRSRRYRRSLRRHRRFLLSYRRSLRRCRDPWGDRRAPIVARLARHQKTLLNIVKYHETHVKHCITSEPLVQHHETLKTLWNIMKQFDAETSALGSATTAIARSYRRYRRGVSGDIGDCGVGITLQMCNRVTNLGDMSTFSKPAHGQLIHCLQH